MSHFLFPEEFGLLSSKKLQNQSGCNDYVNIRTLGFVDEYDWQREVAVFSFRKFKFHINTALFGPFPYKSPSLLHIFAKWNPTEKQWFAYQLVIADGLDLPRFEKCILKKRAAFSNDRLFEIVS